MKKWIRNVREVAEENGFKVSRRRKHLALTRPGFPTVFTSVTPSDVRVLRNLRAQLRRALR